MDAVWLSLFYPSALADGGYDVDDHRDVDPRLGSLDDFDAMVGALHVAGIKVIVDIVPNHTSNRHPWFVQALAGGRGAPERDRYLFREGIGPGGELRPTTGSRSSADRPGRRPVTVSGTSTVSLLSSRISTGRTRTSVRTSVAPYASGPTAGRRFRIDVAHGLRKDLSEPYPPWGEIADLAREDGSHPLWDRDDVHEIYADWRRIFNSIRLVTRLRRPTYTRRDEPGTPRPTVSGMRSTSRCRTRIGGRRTIAA